MDPVLDNSVNIFRKCGRRDSRAQACGLYTSRALPDCTQARWNTDTRSPPILMWTSTLGLSPCHKENYTMSTFVKISPRSSRSSRLPVGVGLSGW